MVYIPCVNTAKVSLEMTLNGLPVAVTLHVLNPSPWTDGTLGDLCASVQSWAASNLMLHASYQLILNEITATDLTTVSSEVKHQIVSPPIPGSLTNPSTAANVALVVTLQTAGRGRSYRGRVYLPGIPAGFLLSPTEFVPTAVADAQSDFSALLTQINTDGWNLVVASFHSLGVPRLTGLPIVITAIRANNRVGSQRRRVPR